MRFSIIILVVITLLSCKKEETDSTPVQFSNKLISGGGTLSYHREISDWYDIEFKSVSQLSDGSYILCGDGGDDLYVMQFDGIGILNWKKNATLGGRYERFWSSRIIALTDDEYVVTANSSNTIERGGIYRSTNFFHRLYAFDNQGAILWDYKGVSPGAIHSFKDLTKRSNLIITAGKYHAGSWQGTGFIQNFIKTDSKSSPSFVKDSLNSIQSISNTSDGGMILCGEFYNYPDETLDLGVIKLDASLNIEWKRRYKNYSPVERQNIREVAGGYILSGHEIGTLKIDQQGDEIWNTATPSTYIDACSDGNIISVEGYFFRKIDSNTGTIIWESAFKSGPNIQLTEVHETSDLGFIAVGYVDDAGKRKGVIIKTNKDGI